MGQTMGFIQFRRAYVYKRQRGGSSEMIWVGIVTWTICGPFKIDESVQLNSASYCDIMDKIVLHYTNPNLSFTLRLVFMSNNASLNVSMFTWVFFEYKSFVGGEGNKMATVMIWFR